MRILLTGSAGFIGFHLAQKLVEQGMEVFGVDNINPYYDTGLKYKRLEVLGFSQEDIDRGQLAVSQYCSRHRFLKLDLNGRQAMERFFSEHQFDVIFHLAAQAGVRYSKENPLAYVDDNLGAFAHVLEGARTQKVQHFVYASSSSVYGLNQNHPYQESHPTQHPVSLYAATKKSNEMMAHAYSYLYNIPTTGLRFFTVYGPWGRPDMAPMMFLKSILNDQPITVFNGGKMYRDFTYIDTVVEGCCAVLKKPPMFNDGWRAQQPQTHRSVAPYAIYNIGGEQTILLSDFIETLEAVVGKRCRKKHQSMPLGDVMRTEACMQHFIADFGPLHTTDLQTGLSRLVAWYQKFYGFSCVDT